MRFAVLASPFFLLCQCAPVRDAPAAQRPTTRPPEKTTAAARLPALPEIPPESIRATRGTFSGIRLEGVAFDARSHRLVMADQAGGPGSRFADARAAARSMGGQAAANAGFFTPQGEPLGLVVSAGKPAGAWNSASSLGGGVWHEDASGRSAISRRETLGKSTAASMRELLQAGPMLIETNRSVSGLDRVKTSYRTLLLWDGGFRWWLGQASPCTLAALAAALSGGEPAGWPVRHALNLDGGRSADLWISSAVPGGPLTRRAPWNRLVRNFLVVAPR